MNAEITAIVNQKGGVGKSFSCINIGIGLARALFFIDQMNGIPYFFERKDVSIIRTRIVATSAREMVLSGINSPALLPITIPAR